MISQIARGNLYLRGYDRIGVSCFAGLKEVLFMSATIQSLTADELLRMPDDGFRYELVKGDLKKMSPAGNKHGRFAMNLAQPLAAYVKANALGVVYAAETGFL